ncbi:hypothetical protein [Shewanella litorisediminis]|uniref:Integral membrane protein n=1 Tax=Shewanella litorisediminis TaxID=1173586 RepID=A0ABX7G218_9GAMM|nr:hypothetical protein [Shewanella litorisediminis]MCL2918537.1 hypothetical protein [Shewanella litorisediminis]QRH01364.1 hypothetical protein JQC75_16165 [Shewanella litorisediminis]
MKLPPLPLCLLLCLYIVLALLSITRAIITGNLDMFTLGVLPVLVGLVLKTSWAIWAVRIYTAIQTLGCAALGVTAILATHISPEDTRLFFAGTEIPLSLVAVTLVALLSFQWWVAFLPSTRDYLLVQAEADTPKNH